MRDRGIISRIENGKIFVKPMLSDTCISCTSSSRGCHGSCGKIGDEFEVSNPKNLEVKEGIFVRISASLKHQTLQGLISLFFPILSSVAGFFLAGHFFTSEKAKALGVLLGLALSSFIVIKSNSLIEKKKAFIDEIL